MAKFGPEALERKIMHSLANRKYSAGEYRKALIILYLEDEKVASRTELTELIGDKKVAGIAISELIAEGKIQRVKVKQWAFYYLI